MKKFLITILAVTGVLFLAGCINPSDGGPGSSFDASAMVSVPGGTYTQQDTNGHSFLHTISAFSIGKYEVTYGLWYEVYQWAVSNGYNFDNAGGEGDDGTVGAAPTDAQSEPVTTISWRDAIVWCNAYSQMNGLAPVYYESGGTVLKDSSDSNAAACDGASVDSSANGYRLPTEGEWQYAASFKDGTSFTPWNWASGAAANITDADACDAVAWYSANAGSDTHPVGEKAANALGLHDMSGNVWEWCWDRSGNYPTTDQTDYAGPASGSVRVRRGGGWINDAAFLQVGYRYGDSPNGEYDFLGFRLCRNAD